ncbi:hypothetical protein KAU11_02470, partial [Candidatus Babeliales bacterium]|nr:hypothetical protein [Candidatus Babeliales bacterium]
ALDSAVESRISEVIHMDRPGTPEKIQLYNLYLKKEVIDRDIRIDSKVKTDRKKLVDIMDLYVVGRDIEEMAQKFRRRAQRSKSSALSFEAAQRVIEEMNEKLRTQRTCKSSLIITEAIPCA